MKLTYLDSASVCRLAMGGLVVACAAGPVVVNASHLSITAPPPQLHVIVGSFGTTVDTVTFTVPSGQEGSGIPITGTPGILIEVAVRRGGAQATTVFLTANSSSPMQSGSNTIPFTQVSWTSDNGIIPSGTFDGSTNQVILTGAAPTGLTRFESTHTFSFANTQIYPQGAYTGTVVYTASVP